MIRLLRKLVVLTLGLGFIVASAPSTRAQDEAAKDVIRPITTAGSAAGIFELAGIGTFGLSGPAVGPLNSAVGVKYYVANGLAIVVLAGFNSLSGVDTGQGAYYTTTSKPSTTKFGIGAGVEVHCRPLFSTSPYWGGMISFGSDSYDNGGTGNADSKNSSSTFGVAALAGFDWFFTNGLCLGGQVALGFTSTSASFTEEGTETDGNGSTVIALATNASVHLNVFF